MFKEIDKLTNGNFSKIFAASPPPIKTVARQDDGSVAEVDHATPWSAAKATGLVRQTSGNVIYLHGPDGPSST